MAVNFRMPRVGVANQQPSAPSWWRWVGIGAAIVAVAVTLIFAMGWKPSLPGLPSGWTLPGASPFPGRRPVIAPPNQPYVEDCLALPSPAIRTQSGLAAQICIKVGPRGQDVAVSAINLDPSAKPAFLRIVTIRRGDGAGGPQAFRLPTVGALFQPTFPLERGMQYTFAFETLDVSGRKSQGEVVVLIPVGMPIIDPNDSGGSIPDGNPRVEPLPVTPQPTPAPSPTSVPSPAAVRP